VTVPARLLLSVGAVLALLLAPSAGATGDTWHGQAVNLPGAQEAGRGGAGVVVAVVDTWVDGAHPDLGGRVLPGADCTGPGPCRPGPPPGDPCSHGTHVAGTVVSSSFGVAPAATVLPVRVLVRRDGKCQGDASDVAEGIRYAADSGADVLNLSLGGGLVPGVTRSPEIRMAIVGAAQRGLVVVVAAGNSGGPLTEAYGEDALVVAATGPSGALAAYSQRDGDVDLAAPGGDAGGASCTESTCIAAPTPGGGFGLLEGTSMAAPHVAGTAALLLAQDPQRGAADVTDTMIRTARPLDGAGAGSLDAARALSLRTSSPPASPPPPPSPVDPAALPPPLPPLEPPAAAEPVPLEEPPAPVGAPTADQPPLAAETSATRLALPAGIALLLVLAAGTATVRLDGAASRRAR
jgi:serine protease